MTSPSPFTPTTPPRIKNTKGLHLLTTSTPNGKKVQILLEELSAKYGLQWTTTLIDLDTDEQKQPWFLALNPNGKIPLLIDTNNNNNNNNNNSSIPITVMESSAILLYLVETYDPDQHFHFSSAVLKSQLIQWLFFWSASGQPQQAGLNYFKRFAGVVDSYAIEKFKAETLRIYNVLELHLSNSLAGCDGGGGEAREYLVGEGRGKYSIADINAYAWIRAWKRMTITEEEMGRFPLLRRWIERIEERPAVERGVGEGYDEEVHPELLLSSTGRD
ncbi:glutathione S-transferase [Aspergillus costaricaensis CBS 115574]|uniref:Glutathione S-transferase n=1 Tax=Aspergillus costaricaensis CBS 115574 TaxID=1448317 RepID=A0ACD1IPV1_9EURO|nr:glutathione S-transferase [Aspergillus costaricaensis CBS 115574]RAK92287.1 glutathione S-transferase [Aspergillus costaricaensis CBS 115574]